MTRDGAPSVISSSTMEIHEAPADVLRVILQQLFTQQPALLQYALPYYKNNDKELCRIFSVLWKIFESATTDPEAGEIICILDAMDECEESARKDLINAIGDFYCGETKTNTALKFLITSRPYSNIEKAFRSKIEDFTSKTINGDDELAMISREIDLVIESKIESISKARQFPFKAEVKYVLISHLKSMKSRTYLWLYLILDVIQHTDESSKLQLEKLVKTIPSTVYDAYERILSRVQDLKAAMRCTSYHRGSRKSAYGKGNEYCASYK